MNRFQRMIFICFLALCTVTVSFNIPVKNVTAAKSITDLKKDLEANTKKKQDAIKQKTEKQAELNSNVDKKNDLDIQLTALQQDIDLIDDTINQKQSEINDKNAQIEELSNKIDENKEILKQRMKIMYENGSTSYLEMIFESKGLSDLYTRVSIVQDIVSHDKNMIQEFVNSKKNIEQARAVVETEQNEQKEAKLLLQDKKNDLAKKQSERDSIISTLKSDISALEKFQEESEKYEEQARAELQKALAAQQDSNKSKPTTPAKVGSGEFCWPSASSTRVTSKYGYRTNPVSGIYKMHTGIDIGAAMGTNVLAAADGIIVTAGWNNGYGNYITINHGNGVATLYGHNSKLLVSAGDSVKKGQVIALVGSTGNSTGPHIHFEVIVNGSTKNPLDYL